MIGLISNPDFEILPLDDAYSSGFQKWTVQLLEKVELSSQIGVDFKKISKNLLWIHEVFSYSVLYTVDYVQILTKLVQ